MCEILAGSIRAVNDPDSLTQSSPPRVAGHASLLQTDNALSKFEEMPGQSQGRLQVRRSHMNHTVLGFVLEAEQASQIVRRLLRSAHLS